MKAYIDQIVNENALLLLGENEKEISNVWVKVNNLEGDRGKLCEGNYLEIDEITYIGKKARGKEDINKVASAIKKGKTVRFTYDKTYNQEMSKRAAEALKSLKGNRADSDFKNYQQAWDEGAISNNFPTRERF